MFSNIPFKSILCKAALKYSWPCSKTAVACEMQSQQASLIWLGAAFAIFARNLWSQNHSCLKPMILCWWLQVSKRDTATDLCLTYPSGIDINEYMWILLCAEFHQTPLQLDFTIHRNQINFCLKSTEKALIFLRKKLKVC